MTHSEIETRLEEIRTADRSTLSIDEINAMTEEVKSLNALDAELRKAAKEAAEQREAVATDETIEAREIATDIIESEVKPMNLNEIRSSEEYSRAYLKAIKGDMTEARALLSTNVDGGYIPVPTMLETEIKNAWEKYGLMALVKKSYFAGNVKIGFELSAGAAVVHTEGDNAPNEETITIGAVELKPESIKKWITVSDEAIEGTTVDTMGYLYAEIAQKIVEKAESVLVGKITAASTSNSASACGVKDYVAAPAIDTIVNALALLSAQARDIHIAMNRQTYAALKATSLNNKWGADPFDGLKDRVVFTDKLPAYSAADASACYIIAGDFGYGAQANFPNGQDITLKVDALSLAEKDLVKVVGRQYVGMGVVAPFAFVRVKKPASNG